MPACGQAVGCGVCDMPELWRGAAGRGPVCACTRVCVLVPPNLYIHIHTHIPIPIPPPPPPPKYFHIIYIYIKTMGTGGPEAGGTVSCGCIS